MGGKNRAPAGESIQDSHSEAVCVLWMDEHCSWCVHIDSCEERFSPGVKQKCLAWHDRR